MRRCLFTAVLFASALIRAADAQEGPKGAVVLIIRHAEDAGTGRGLSPRGQQRAEGYKDYFKNFTVDSKRLCPDAIFVAKDSKKSHRPRLTVEPFAKAERLRIDTRFGNDQSAELAADLRETEQGSGFSSVGATPTSQPSFARWEQSPKTYCRGANGPVPFSIGSSCLAAIRTAI